MCGLDPMEGWDRTPGELIEYIHAAQERDKRHRAMLGALAFDYGIHVSRCICGKAEPAWRAFPGFLEMPVQREDELWATLEAWADYDPEKLNQNS